MKKTFISLYLLIAVISLSAQTKFVTSGKIEFERKTNVHRLYFTKEDMDSWDEEFKKLVPVWRTDYFDLTFSDNKSLYKPGRGSDEVKKGFFFPTPGGENVVYKDLDAGLSTSQKQIFESQFLINDSLKKLTWKLEPETRTIAGFECRKAITRICDSVVVVAFYTEEIVPASGPESFGGLPGMILGLAVPRLYTTWFATKMELIEEKDEKKIAAPAKGKKATDKELTETMNSGLKQWGPKYKNPSIWSATL